MRTGKALARSTETTIYLVDDKKQATPNEGWDIYGRGRNKTCMRCRKTGRPNPAVRVAIQPMRAQKCSASAQSMASIAFLSGEGVGSLEAPLLMRLDLHRGSNQVCEIAFESSSHSGRRGHPKRL